MTKNEKAALLHLIADLQVCRSQGNTYDHNMQLIEAGDGPGMLDSPHYKLGWKRCAEYVQLIIEEILLKPQSNKEVNAGILKWIGKEKLKELLAKG